jgi:three-Cys-motif partner protein
MAGNAGNGFIKTRSVGGAKNVSGQAVVTASDGGLALLTGQWSVDKHDYIHRLSGIFSTGMKNTSRYRCYIDLFAGPGRCVIEDTKTELPGSPLQAIDIRDRFTHYFFNDISPASIEALRSRVASLNAPPVPVYFTDDCNDVVPRLRQALPPANESLELAIIDAWGWEMSFDALALLTKGRRMDIVVTFPIGFIKRNWRRELERLDKFLGGDGYKEAFFGAMEHDSGEASRILLDYYEGRLKEIGYKYPNDEVWIPNTKQVKLYHLVFASKHPRGNDFWAKITKRSPKGQYKLPW